MVVLWKILWRNSPQRLHERKRTHEVITRERTQLAFMESLSKRAQWPYPAIHNERRENFSPRLNDETNNRSNTYQKNPRKKEYERERRMEYRVFTTRKN